MSHFDKKINATENAHRCLETFCHQIMNNTNEALIIWPILELYGLKYTFAGPGPNPRDFTESHTTAELVAQPEKIIHYLGIAQPTITPTYTDFAINKTVSVVLRGQQMSADLTGLVGRMLVHKELPGEETRAALVKSTGDYPALNSIFQLLPKAAEEARDFDRVLILETQMNEHDAACQITRIIFPEPAKEAPGPRASLYNWICRSYLDPQTTCRRLAERGTPRVLLDGAALLAKYPENHILLNTSTIGGGSPANLVYAAGRQMAAIISENTTSQRQNDPIRRAEVSNAIARALMPRIHTLMTSTFGDIATILLPMSPTDPTDTEDDSRFRRCIWNLLICQVVSPPTTRPLFLNDLCTLVENGFTQLGMPSLLEDNLPPTLQRWLRGWIEENDQPLSVLFEPIQKALERCLAPTQ